MTGKDFFVFNLFINAVRLNPDVLLISIILTFFSTCAAGSNKASGCRTIPIVSFFFGCGFF